MAYGISIRDKRRRPVAGCFTPFVIITGIAFFFTPSGFITDKLSGDTTLSGAEIRQLFAGKTVSGYHVKRGYSFTSYYEPDGTYRSYQSYGLVPDSFEDMEPRHATWVISSDQICITWQDTGEGPLCRHMIRDRAGNYTKVLKKGGRKITVVRFNSFEPGNPENL